MTGRNTGDNLGDEHYPTIHFEEGEGDEVVIQLILKGGGCENVGAQDKLPDSRMGAGRDLEGVRRVALDAVQLLGGNGYINEYPTGRFLRDAKLYEIGAGTSEIRRMLIGREMFEETR